MWYDKLTVVEAVTKIVAEYYQEHGNLSLNDIIEIVKESCDELDSGGVADVSTNAVCNMTRPDDIVDITQAHIASIVTLNKATESYKQYVKDVLEPEDYNVPTNFIYKAGYQAGYQEGQKDCLSES